VRDKGRGRWRQSRREEDEEGDRESDGKRESGGKKVR